LAGPVPYPATTLLAALHDSGAINASSLTSSPTITHNVHIYYRPSPSLTLVDCIAEPVDVNGDTMLGCAFSTHPGANDLIVVTLDYSLVRPVEELPDEAVGVMKRIYGELCAKIIGQACEDYAFPAVFAGVSGDEIMRGDGGWTDFRAAVEKARNATGATEQPPPATSAPSRSSGPRPHPKTHSPPTAQPSTPSSAPRVVKSDSPSCAGTAPPCAALPDVAPVGVWERGWGVWG
ncbi:hypothetical protein BDK51DRAFT_51078, partial [Blyttiomyces helicus]